MLRNMNKHIKKESSPTQWRLSRPLAALLLAGVALTPSVMAQKLFFENFDGVPLGPNPEEASKGAKVWTKTPPAGWVIDDTGMPGFGTPEYAANDGRTEWSGWSFADARWWPTVDNQRRAEFLLATGAAATGAETGAAATTSATGAATVMPEAFMFLAAAALALEVAMRALRISSGAMPSVMAISS